MFLFEFLPNDSVIQPDSTSQENRHTTQVGVFFGRGGFGAYELSSEVRRAAEYKLNLFGDRVRAVQTSVDVAMVCFHVKGR